MQYQISYLSPLGHAEKLAAAFERMLPSDTMTINLDDESDARGEIHLVGFELGSKMDAIPYKILEFLEKLDEKIIFLFATCPIPSIESVKERAERAVVPFLPEDCDYRGLFMCRGQASKQFMMELENFAQQQPYNEKAKVWLSQCKKSEGHPNREDLRQACRFAAEILELNI